MFIVLGCAFLVLVCIVGAVITNLCGRDAEGWRIGAILLSMPLLLSILALLIAPLEIRSEIAQFNETMRTLEAARVNPNISPFEIAAIQQKVIEMNQWLARSQYWAKHPLTNWFWPKAIFELEAIR